MKSFIKNISLRLLTMPMIVGVALVSCTEDAEQSLEGDKKIVDEIEVSVATRSIEDGHEFGLGENTGIDLDALIPFSLKFDENTIIQVSQRSRLVPPFETEDNIFDFVYKKNSEASWNDEATYNFTPYELRGAPLEWNRIASAGSTDAGYALYSLYFPVDNSIQERLEAGSHIYTVKQDQSTLDNLKASDILGAYHSTPAIFTRIRFRMFHLMTYLRIRLYVPVFDEEKNTGYREGALLGASINHVTPEFTINWGKVTSGDSEGPEVKARSGDGEIKMYQHPLKDGKTEHEITQIEYKKFLIQGYYDQGITGDYDKVRIYDFSVLLPIQEGKLKDDGVMHPFTEDDFLNFYFRSNSGAETRYYFDQSLVGNQEDGSTSNELHFEQGNFQYLELYVPRVGNQLVFIGAKVKPWDQKGTDMVLNQVGGEDD